MISYYVDKGYNLTDLINMTYVEKQFMFASMNHQHEIRIKELEAIYGGGK